MSNGEVRQQCWKLPWRFCLMQFRTMREAHAAGAYSTMFCESSDEAPASLRPMTEAQLQSVIAKVGRGVGVWDEETVELVSHLQEAGRNNGVVQLMRLIRDGGRMVAVKRMPNDWVRAGQEEFETVHPTAGERPWHDMGFVQHLSEIGFPYVCRLHGVFRSETETFVVSDFCTEGDLFTWVEGDIAPCPGRERETCMLALVTQIFSGVRWLHDLGIAHRDLSLENLLLTDVGTGQLAIRIIDFGMSSLSRFSQNEIRGKASYQAPEMHIPDEAMDAFLGDNFALGVIVFAMASQDYPWTGTRRHSCPLFEYVFNFGLPRFLERRKLRKGSGEHLVEVLSPELLEMLDSLLRMKPQQRACLGEACFASGVLDTRPNVWDMEWMRRGPGMLWSLA